VAFLQVNADRDQAVRGERVEDPVGELEAARAASAALATRGLAMQSAEVSPSAVAAVMKCWRTGTSPLDLTCRL
jgi:hypothetical protein